jgi:methanol--5-hydroxybenzimidazolylcobamide Co-methyltransferase
MRRMWSRFRALAIEDSRLLRFGHAPRPLRTRRGLTIGGGAVYPELNFTLPAMSVDAATMPQVLEQYQQIIDDALKRAVELQPPGIIIEFETLPPMTIEPAWAIDITRLLNDAMEDASARHGLPSALRITPTDIREFARPPVIRSGKYWDNLVQTFDGCAAAGAELLSIESVGGKEVHDEALLAGDMAAVIFGLCVMGVRDMRYLWTEIGRIADRRGVVSAGDTACGFGNTAMVLAEKKLISRVFAAVVRAVSAVRSLVAYDCGAVGPGKDCGYENVYLKAITGCPMAMEGKSAACAHLSPLGNIAGYMCDTWSNESVQNIRLLGGMAPTVSLEQLVYDCRMMNQAAADGPEKALLYRDWMVRSDAGLDPQAFVLSPDPAVAIARAIVEASDAYSAGRAAALAAVSLLESAHEAGALPLAAREKPWLQMIRSSVEELPDREEAFIGRMMDSVDTQKFIATEYDL